MTCLRAQALEGRRGALQCDEEGCDFRLRTPEGSPLADAETSPDYCLLQLRLRAGDSEEPISAEDIVGFMRREVDRMSIGPIEEPRGDGSY